MTPDERNLIAGLFDRLRGADTNPKDREAEQLIQAKVAEQPAAPYLLAQTVLVQEHALTNAQARIAQLERQIAQAPAAAGAGGGGSFLSGIFGGHAASSAALPTSPSPYPSTVNMAPSAGGGFLRTALAAAAGVAGGSLLFNGIEGLLGHNSGVFGSSLGGGGFLGGGGRPEVIENNEVVNNYYDGDGAPHDPGAQSADFTDTPPPMDDAPAYQEADYAPDDSSNDDFSGDDSSFSDDGGGLV